MRITEPAFQLRIANIYRRRLTGHTLSAAQRESAAVSVRRLADTMKRGDPLFCFEWFFGACGLDHWGDLIELEPVDLEEDSG